MRREGRKRPDADERGYDNDWRKFRKVYLKLNPYCVYCKKEGRTRKAEHVDHIGALRNNLNLKYDPRNLRSLCAWHHNRRTAIDQRWAVKEVLRIGPDGYPTDPDHPARKADR